ncbi:MAG: L,D-transpeptidase family protein [Deltaproteobacteria bacterium]|nr:L,D-transpeptidase family protein [Deltaproteobacteria bacterium]
MSKSFGRLVIWVVAALAAIIVPRLASALNVFDNSGQVPRPISFENIFYMNTDAKSFYIILVDKSAQELHVYQYAGGAYTQKKTFPCATGENNGHKLKEGDKKTPEGIYFIVSYYHDNKKTVFGYKAYHLDYPNPFDRLHGSKGDGIWIHGSNKSLKTRSTNGCIVLKDQDLDELTTYIKLGETPVIVTPHMNHPAFTVAANHTASLYAFLKDWRTSYLEMQKMVSNFYRLYGDNFQTQRYSSPLYRDINYALNPTRPILGMEIDDLKIFQMEKVAIVAMNQELKVSDVEKTTGVRRLYLEERKGRWHIIGDEWKLQGSDAAPTMLAAGANPDSKQSEKIRTEPFPGNSDMKQPVVAEKAGSAPPVTPKPAVMSTAPAGRKGKEKPAVKSPEPAPEKKKPSAQDMARGELQSILEQIQKAWEGKQVDKYISFHHPGFICNGMNLAQWKDYKASTFKKYQYINVTFKDVKIKIDQNQAVVSFVQIFKSSSFRDKGYKEIVFKKQGRAWKIYREKWTPLGG